jgi:hypothetical protein
MPNSRRRIFKNFQMFYSICQICQIRVHEQFVSYLAAVTIIGGRAANLDFCLALKDFSSEGSLTCHTCCDTKPLLLRLYIRKTCEAKVQSQHMVCRGWCNGDK